MHILVYLIGYLSIKPSCFITKILIFWKTGPLFFRGDMDAQSVNVGRFSEPSSDYLVGDTGDTLFSPKPQFCASSDYLLTGDMF